MRWRLLKRGWILRCVKCGWNHYEKRIDRCTLEEVTAFCAELGLPANDAEYMHHHWVAYGWSNRGMKIKNWKAVVRSWKAAGYMPSQRPALPDKTSVKEEMQK